MSQSLTIDPIPNYDPLVSAERISASWYRWLSQLVVRVLASALVLASVHRTGISSSIVATTIYTPTQPGTYRVSWTVQVTTAASIASSVAVTLTWIAGTVTQTEAFTALTGNATTTHGSGSVLIRPDSSQPIKYATTYSTTGTAMVHGLDVTVEQVAFA